jgi:hypothetical protein
VRLTGYRASCKVTGFRRAKNSGPVVTIAEATWQRDGFSSSYAVRDWATLMRLADYLGEQGYHNLPRNPDRAYSVPKYAKSRGDTGSIVA